MEKHNIWELLYVLLEKICSPFIDYFDFNGEKWEKIKGFLSEDMGTNKYRGLISEVNFFLHRRVSLYSTLAVTFVTGVVTLDIRMMFAVPAGIWIMRAAWCVKLVRKNTYHLVESMGTFKRILVGRKWYWRNEWDSVSDKENYKLRLIPFKSRDVDLSNFSGPVNVFERLQIGADGITPSERRRVFYDRYYNWDSVKERKGDVQKEVDSFLRRIFEKAKNLQDIQQANEADYYFFHTVSDKDRGKHEDTLLQGGYCHPSRGKRILFTGPELPQKYKDSTANRYDKTENAKAEKAAMILKAEGKKKAIELVAKGRVNAIGEYTKKDGLNMDVAEAVKQRNIETKRGVLENADNVTIFDDDIDGKRERPKKDIIVGNTQSSKKEETFKNTNSSKEGEK